MAQLPPGFVFDDEPSAPAPSGPVYGAPPKEDKPDAPKTTYRTLSPEEAAAQGLPPGRPYQVSSEGKVDALPESKKPLPNPDRLPQVRSALDNIKRLRQLSQESLAVGGMSGRVGDVPLIGGWLGQNRKDVEGSLEMVEGDLIQQQIAALSAASGGGGVASLANSETEARRMAASIANLSPDQSLEEFTRGLDRAEEYYKRQLAQLGGKVDETPTGQRSPNAVYDERGDYVGLSGSVTDESTSTAPPPPAAPSPTTGNSPGYQQIAAGIGDVIEGGFNNTLGIVVNPIGRTLMEATGYGGREYNGGQILRDTLGLPEGDPRISPFTEAASGGLGMAGLARGAAAYAPGAVGNALATMGSTPIRDTSAALSSVAAGQGVSALGGGPMAQTVAQVAGGALGYAAPNALSAVRGVGGVGRPPPDLNRAVIAAGERQGVPVRLPDASASARNQMAVAEAAPYSGPTVKRAMAGDREIMADRVRAQGSGGTPMTEDYTLGQRAQGTGSRYIERTRQQKNVKYTEAEQLSQGQRVKADQAISEVDRNIAELEASGANNNAATISYLKGLREDLSKPEGFSITEFQGLRSGAGKKIKGDQALTVTDADRRLNSVVKAFNADAKEQLPPQASDALQNADYFYAQRQDYIKKVLQPFLGTQGKPMSPEQAGKAIRGMTAGRANHDNLKRFLAEANPDEVADFRATIAEGLVTGPKGEVGAAQLASNIAKVPDNIRTLVFGKDGAAALKDIQLLATEKGNTTSGLNNSKSGVVGAAGKIGLRGLLTGVFGFGVGGGAGAVALPIATELAASLGQARTARLLLNPNFTKWLRQTPNTTKAAAIDNHFKRLGEISARSPIIANDARALQDSLLQAFGQSPGRAAAETDNEQNGRRKPPQQ